MKVKNKYGAILRPLPRLLISRKLSSHKTIYQLTSSAVNMTVKVTATDGLNIRQGAATSFAKLGAIPCGRVVNVTRQTSGGGYTWGLVECDGVMGWIALDYTKEVGKSIDELAKISAKVVSSG